MIIIEILYYAIIAAGTVQACIFMYKLWTRSWFSPGWVIMIIPLLATPHFIFPAAACLAKLDIKKRLLAWSPFAVYAALSILFSLTIKELAADLTNWQAVMTGSLFARPAMILYVLFIWKKFFPPTPDVINA